MVGRSFAFPLNPRQRDFSLKPSVALRSSAKVTNCLWAKRKPPTKPAKEKTRKSQGTTKKRTDRSFWTDGSAVWAAAPAARRFAPPRRPRSMSQKPKLAGADGEWQRAWQLGVERTGQSAHFQIFDPRHEPQPGTWVPGTLSDRSTDCTSGDRVKLRNSYAPHSANPWYHLVAGRRVRKITTCCANRSCKDAARLYRVQSRHFVVREPSFHAAKWDIILQEA